MKRSPGSRRSGRNSGSSGGRRVAISRSTLAGRQPTSRLGGKWVELLKEIAPRVARVTLLFNPAMATFVEGYLNPFKAAAASLGVEAILAPVHDMSELESVIAAQAASRMVAWW
jgi:hypothetical protein